MRTAIARFSLFSLLCLAAAGAQAQQTAEGRTYALGAFDRLDVEGSARVRLVQGERDQIFIAGGEDVQSKVEVERNGKRLEIRPSGSWKFWNSKRLQIDVEVRELRELSLSGATDLVANGTIKTDKLNINISGAGHLRFDDLQADQLRFDISGAGDGQLAGAVGSLGISVSGKGKLLAEQLKAGKANVSISGIGDAKLWVTEELRVSISGVGSVDYWGKPELRKSTSGFGSVNARGEKKRQ